MKRGDAICIRQQGEGLGDHIFIVGPVRHLALLYRQVVVVCPDRYNLESFHYFYRDLPNVVVVLEGCEPSGVRAVRISERKRRTGDKRQRLDEWSVCQLGVPFRLSWDAFRFERDRTLEQLLVRSVKLSRLKSNVFVHDDPGRGYVIDPARIPRRSRVIRPSGTKGSTCSTPFGAWLGVLERCDEIHCIESSFSALVDRCPSVEGKLVFHRYPRRHPTEKWKATRLRKWERLG